MAKGKNQPPAIWRERLQKARVEKAAEVAAIKLEGLRQTREQHRQVADVVDARIAELEAVAANGSTE